MSSSLGKSASSLDAEELAQLEPVSNSGQAISSAIKKIQKQRASGEYRVEPPPEIALQQLKKMQPKKDAIGAALDKIRDSQELEDTAVTKLDLLRKVAGIPTADHSKKGIARTLSRLLHKKLASKG